MNFMALMLGAAVFLNSVYCTDAAKMPPEAWYKVYVELATGSGSSARGWTVATNSCPWSWAQAACPVRALLACRISDTSIILPLCMSSSSVGSPGATYISP